MVEQIKKRVTTIREKIHSMGKADWAIVILVIILLGVSLKVFGGFGNKAMPEYAGYAHTTLEVINVDLASPKKIKILFNADVDLHELQHHLTITPSLNGKLTYGKNESEFYFENAEDFPRATTLNLEIADGLVSKNGLPYLSKAGLSLQTNISGGQVAFKKDGVFARILMGSPGVPIPIEIEAGKSVYNNTITIYKSTQADLLNYLIYSVPQNKIKDDGSFDEYAITFKENYRSHPKSAKIESFEVAGSLKKELNLESGIYYIEATDNELPVGSAFLIVSKAGIVFRQDDKKVILSAFNTKTGEKISERVDAGFYDLRDAPKLLDRTVFTDYASVNTPFEKKVDVILATIGNETVLVPVKIKESLADIRVNKNLDSDTQMFIYTDRPIYKPGDTVFYRGLVRIDNDAVYRLPKEGMKVRVSAGNVLVDVDKNGVFSGKFVLPKDVENEYGQVTVTLSETAEGTLDYNNYASAYFSVKKYKKPTFELTIVKDKEEYYQNEKVALKVKGTYFNSEPLAKEKVEYNVYNTNFYEQEKKVYNQNFNITQAGGMCGGGGVGDYYGEVLTKNNINLDGNGAGEIVIDLKKIKLPPTSQTVTFAVSKKDTKSDNVIQSVIKAVVHAGAYSIFFIPSPSQYMSGEEMVVPFYIESSVSGDKPPSEAEYELRTTKYESGKSKEEVLATGKVAVDDTGKGVIKHKVPDVENSLTVLIRSQDANGNKIESSKWVGVYKNDDVNNQWQGGSPLQTYLKITTDSNSYVVGNTIKLNINSQRDLDVLLSPERGRMYEPKIIHLNKGENILEIPATNEMSPSITLTFSFFADGRYYSEGVSLNVPAMHKLLTVQIEKDKDTYKPNETANLTVTIKDAQGNPVSGVFSLGVVDEAIYGLRKDATPLIHSSFYYKRERSTNASSSLTMIGRFDYGGRGGGGGGGGDGQSVDTLFWAPALQTDENGKAVVSVKLNSAQTIWRAQVIASDDQTDLGQSYIKLQVK